MTQRYTWVGWLPVGSIAAVVAAVYSAWFIAYVQLGRAPIPSMDDPKYIGGYSTTASSIAGLVVMVSLAVGIVGMTGSFVFLLHARGQERRRWATKVGMGVAAMSLLLLLVRFSPGDACRWMLD